MLHSFSLLFPFFSPFDFQDNFHNFSFSYTFSSFPPLPSLLLDVFTNGMPAWSSLGDEPFIPVSLFHFIRPGFIVVHTYAHTLSHTHRGYIYRRRWHHKSVHRFPGGSLMSVTPLLFMQTGAVGKTINETHTHTHTISNDMCVWNRYLETVTFKKIKNHTYVYIKYITYI